MKHSTLPSTASPLLLREGRERSNSFPTDPYSPTSPQEEKSFTTEVPLSFSSPLNHSHSQQRQVTQQTNKVSSISTHCQTGSTVSQSSTSANVSPMDSESIPSSQPSAEKRVHLQCDVMNAKTSKPVKCTSSTNQNHPLFRNIKLKVKRYDTVLPNTPLQLQISADQACYVYVINIGSSGDETVLVPNEFDMNNHLEAGTQMLFPPFDADYEFELDEDCGTETIVLLAYEQPLAKNEQALTDCGRLRTKYESTQLFRGIKIKAKQTEQEVIGYLEVYFVVSV